MMRKIASTLLAAGLVLAIAPALAAGTGPSEEAATPCAGKVTELQPEKVCNGTPPGMDGWAGALGGGFGMRKQGLTSDRYTDQFTTGWARSAC